jgi:DNA-binding transcriptional MerR regulator
MEIDSNPPSHFVIGAVARATGIPVETLRIWERRYGVVIPHRDAANKRFYTTDDITRLKLIKQLVDLGHAISSVAKLSDSALAEQLRVHRPRDEAAISLNRVRVMVCGEMLPGMAQTWDLGNLALDMVGSYTNIRDFESAACAQFPQILVLETPFLTLDILENLAELVARTAARRGVVIYSYAPAALVDSGQKLGLWMRRGPLHLQAFREICRINDAAFAFTGAASLASTEEAPPPRFNSATLARIANQANSIRCECPQHLAELVFRIHAFERYSADCQNRNEQDAAIHANLRICAGKARALFEDALAFLLETEGLDGSEDVT